MRPFKNLQRHRLAVLSAGAVVLIIVALVESSSGWLGCLCLVPLILAACLPDTWDLAAGSTGGLVLSAVFGSIPWVPQPTTVMFIVAVLCLVQIQHLRDDYRRKETELETERKQHQEWRTFFENSPAAILTADDEGRIVMANQAAQRLLGFENQPVTG